MYTSELMNHIDFSINCMSDRYHNTDNVSVPRVTDILSTMIHTDSLMVWANNLGFRGIKYKTELNRAASFGTQAHACIENYLKTKTKSLNNIPFLGYLLWEEVIGQKGLVPNPIMIEEKMSCKWFGGTLDAVFDIGSKLYLTDFKTSNHVTYKYFLQLAAYLYLLSIKNIYPNGVIVLQLHKAEPGFNEYLLDFSIPDHKAFIDHCTQTFFSLVYAYYNIKKAETDYKVIFN